MMEMKIQRLDEVIGNNEIFSTIMTGRELPWHEDTTITAELLDFEYINNYSGRKIISPAVEKSLGTDGKITTANFEKLCSVAYMMYGKKWARNWAILTMEYNPIENYSMVEDSKLTRDNKETHSGTDSVLMTGTDTNAESGTNTVLMTGTDTNTESGTNSLAHGEKHTLSGSDGLQHGETHTQSGSDGLLHGEKHTLSGTDSQTDTRATENEVSAFNSSSYSDSTKSTNSGSLGTTYGKTDTASGTDTTTYGKVDTASGTDTTTYGKVDTASGTDQTTFGHVNTESRNMSDATTFGHQNQETRNMTDATTHGHIIDNDDDERNHLTRSGNIGVTTSQQMAESDIQLWKWNFFYEVFSDIDNVFTISTY